MHETSSQHHPDCYHRLVIRVIPLSPSLQVIKSPAPDLVVPSPCPNFNDFITADFKNKGDRAAITVANPDGSVDVRTFADLLADVDSVANELRTQIGFKV